MLTQTRDGMDDLMDYIVQTAARRPELLAYQPQVATDFEQASSAVLKVDTEDQARFSVLLSEALMQMSRDFHPEGEQANDEVTGFTAVILVEEHGGIRKAARATGIDRNKLWRALRTYKELAI